MIRRQMDGVLGSSGTRESRRPAGLRALSRRSKGPRELSVALNQLSVKSLISFTEKIRKSTIKQISNSRLIANKLGNGRANQISSGPEGSGTAAGGTSSSFTMMKCLLFWKIRRDSVGICRVINNRGGKQSIRGRKLARTRLINFIVRDFSSLIPFPDLTP